jgi:hypothetical protein
MHAPTYTNAHAALRISFFFFLNYLLDSSGIGAWEEGKTTRGEDFLLYFFSSFFFLFFCIASAHRVASSSLHFTCLLALGSLPAITFPFLGLLEGVVSSRLGLYVTCLLLSVCTIRTGLIRQRNVNVSDHGENLFLSASCTATTVRYSWVHVDVCRAPAPPFLRPSARGDDSNRRGMTVKGKKLKIWLLARTKQPSDQTPITHTDIRERCTYIQ